MNNPVIIPMSQYFNGIFNNSSLDEIRKGADELSSNITSQFAAFFADPVFCSLSLHDKTTITYFYKSILQMVVDTRDEAIACYSVHRLTGITVPEDIAGEYCSDIEGYIAAAKLCQDSFRALLRQDIGDDLNVNGYINTDAADLNAALLEFFADVFRVYTPGAFVKKNYGPLQMEVIGDAHSSECACMNDVAMSPVLQPA